MSHNSLHNPRNLSRKTSRTSNQSHAFSPLVKHQHSASRGHQYEEDTYEENTPATPNTNSLGAFSPNPSSPGGGGPNASFSSIHESDTRLRDIELEELERLEPDESHNGFNSTTKQQRKQQQKFGNNDSKLHDDMDEFDENEQQAADGSVAADNPKSNRVNQTAHNVFDAIVTSCLNMASFLLMVASLAVPAVLLMVVEFQFNYVLIFSALVLPALLALLTTYYSCTVWLRGAKACSPCLIINGFIAFGIVCASVSFILSIGGTFSLIEYYK